jgi:hypothetical protein
MKYLFICSNIRAASANGVCLSWLIQFSRAWYPLFQGQWDQQNHQTQNYLVKGLHLYLAESKIKGSG